MASKRDVLELLTRGELLAAVDLFGVEVRNRRGKSGILGELVASRKVKPGQVVAELSRDRLKELYRAVGQDDSGREKSVLVERLAGGAQAASRGNVGVASRAKSKGDGKLKSDQIERYSRSAAEVLSGSGAASPDKNLIPGMFFLKRLSDRLGKYLAPHADGAMKEDVQRKMRNVIKRALRAVNYPPERLDYTVEGVLNLLKRRPFARRPRSGRRSVSG
jgi:hypothetical protein